MLRVLTIWHLAVSGVCCAVYLVPTIIADIRVRKRLGIKKKIFNYITEAINFTLFGCFFLTPIWNMVFLLAALSSYTEKGTITALEEELIKEYSERESE